MLPIVALNCLAPFKETFPDEKMQNFLNSIVKEYKTEVQYHNDLHGADVMQFSNYLLTTCGLRESLSLNDLDCFSMLMAALCHDLGHDGFTNSYHVNAFTKRAIASNDVSVQETYHVAKMFEILSES